MNKINEKIDKYLMNEATMFSKRYYNRIVSLLKSLPITIKKEDLIEEFSRMFKEDNPNYDTDRFMKAVK